MRSHANALAALAVFAACSDASPAIPDTLSFTADASHATADAPPGSHTDAPAATGDGGELRTLVVNEVAAAGNPDWIEIVNATTAPIELSDYIYVDKAGDFAKAATFPAMTLGPGAYYAQDVSTAISGFALGSDEEVWVYRKADDVLSDGVDWNAGDSPDGGSFARIPDIFGPFVTTTHPTKGTPNGTGSGSD